MIDDLKIREHDADDDFEWINNWAGTAARPAVAAARAAANSSNAAIGREPAGPAVAAIASTPWAVALMAERGESEEKDAPSAEADDAAAIASREPVRPGRQQWTSLFRLVARAHERPAGHGAADAAAADLDRAEDFERTHGEPGSLDLGQIERDIADIVSVRDRLLAETEPERRRRRAIRFAVRMSDYVPILVGGVLAFTSLVVFAAAASFVSLR